MCDDIRLHVARSYTSSADSPFSLISSFNLPNHLLLGLPLFLLPCTFITIALLPTSCSSLLITCIYNFNLVSWTFFVISPTFVVPLILSFLILSSVVPPYIHRCILISETSNFISRAFFNAHVYAPHISAGSNNVCTFPPWHSLSVLPPSLHSVGDFRIHAVIHPPPTQIPGMWMASLTLLSLPVNGSLRLDVNCTPRLILLSTNIQSSLFHCFSPFLKLPFYMLSSIVLHSIISYANSIHQGAALWWPVPSHPWSCQTGRDTVPCRKPSQCLYKHSARHETELLFFYARLLP